jgi:hypothetical protein
MNGKKPPPAEFLDFRAGDSRRKPVTAEECGEGSAQFFKFPQSAASRAPFGKFLCT